jgi:hypothetical protein
MAEIVGFLEANLREKKSKLAGQNRFCHTGNSERPTRRKKWNNSFQRIQEQR